MAHKVQCCYLRQGNDPTLVCISQISAEFPVSFSSVQPWSLRMVGMFVSLTSGFPLLEILTVTLDTSVISSFYFTSSSSEGIKTHWTLLTKYTPTSSHAASKDHQVKCRHGQLSHCIYIYPVIYSIKFTINISLHLTTQAKGRTMRYRE